MFVAPVTFFNTPLTTQEIPISGSAGVFILPSGSTNNSIVYLNTPYSNYIYFFNTTYWPENQIHTFRIKPGTNQTVSFTDAYNGMVLPQNLGFALEEGYELRFQNISGSITHISGKGATYPDKIFIIGQPGSHETMVESNYIATYPGASGSILQARDKYAPITDWFYEQYYRSVGYQCKQILASYIGNILYAYTGLKDQVTNVVLPIGSNTTNELVSYPYELQPTIFYISTGNTTQRTRSYGTALEFWEIAGSNSAGTPIVAAKFQQILDTLECTHWEARYRARITATRTTTTHPSGGYWNRENGYGKIDVAAAVAYTGSIPENPFTTGGNLYIPHTS
jgi:hypothetical protein